MTITCHLGRQGFKIGFESEVETGRLLTFGAAEPRQYAGAQNSGGDSAAQRIEWPLRVPAVKAEFESGHEKLLQERSFIAQIN